MNKYKIILCLILAFISGCTNIQEDQTDISNGTNDQVVNEHEVKDDGFNIEEIQQVIDDKVVNNDSIKEEKNDNETVNKTSTKNEEVSQSKPSFSNGKDDSSKNESSKDEPIKDDNPSKADNKKEEAFDKQETKEEESNSVIDSKAEAKPKENPICTQHKWDDSYGNSPQFSELIFDDWQECDLVMNDIYNNFISEEKPEYEKYYKNSNGQWISSIAAMDVWCECGAHKYAIFITYE